MATKRKQQTIQFLFEASPENNITRCLISTTSNTFENSEGQDVPSEISFEKERDGVRHDNHVIKERGCQPFSISVKTNDKEGDEQLSSARRGMDLEKGAEQNDFDVKTESGCKQILNKKENFLGRARTELGIANSNCSDRRDGNKEYTMPDSEDGAIDEDGRSIQYSLKNPNRFSFEDKNQGTHNDFSDTNYQPRILEFHPDHDAEGNSSFDNKHHSNYHNISSQNTRSNPEGKEPRDLIPLLDDSNNIAAKNEGENSTLEQKDGNKERQVLSKFDATPFEGNESKYLHIIDYDIQEPPPVIKNFDHSAAEDQLKNPSKIEHIERSKNFREINDNSDETFHEPRSKYPFDFESKIQLPDLSNPQRLPKRQTKQQASLQGIADIEGRNEVTFKNVSRSTKQSGNKVKNLVHEYELQVMNEGHHRQDDKRGKQSILLPKSKNIDLILCDNEHQSNIQECRATYVQPLNTEKPLLPSSEAYNSEMDKLLNSHNTSNPHSSAKQTEYKSLSSARSVKRSPDGSSTSAFRPIVKEHPLANSENGNRSANRSFPLDKGELGSKYEQNTSTSDPRVIKAHWYDIHSISRQSSRVILRPSELKKWKSLGELDRMEQAEEYKLPEQLCKTETYVPGQYFESNLHSRFQTIENNQIVSSGLYVNGRNSPSIGLATKTKSPSLSRKNRYTDGYTKQGEDSSSSFDKTRDHGNVSSYQSTQGTQDRSPLKRSAFLRRQQERDRNIKNVGNTSDPAPLFEKTTDNSSFSSSPSSWSNQSYIKQSPLSEIEQKDNNFSMTLHGTNGCDNLGSRSSILVKPSQSSVIKAQSPRKEHEKPSETDKKDNNFSILSLLHNTSGHGNLGSLSSALVKSRQSSSIGAQSRRKEHEKPSDYDQNDSSLFHGIGDHNNNLSSSLTALETIDQSPMRRSQKLKNLLNIEYYDINSDDELNSKIKRRPRTKSLNNQDKSRAEDVPARREFKSSEDLRSGGLSEEVNGEHRDGEQAWLTRENFDVPSTDSNYLSQGHSRPTYAAKLVSPGNEGLDMYQRHSKVQVPTNNTRNCHSSQKPNTAITDDSNTGGLNPHEKHSKWHLGRNERKTAREIQKSNDLFGYSRNNMQQKESKSDNVSKQYRKDRYNVSTSKSQVKGLPSLLHKSKDKEGKGHKHLKKDTKDIRESKSTIFSMEDFKANEGKYNIAKAEEEWKRRYGGLPYNKKDPLHQSSDKDFSRLFQNTEDDCATQNNTSQSRLKKKRYSLEEAIRNTSSLSLFSPNNSVNKIASNSIASNSDEFSTTLHHLSSYVISGYKEDSKENAEQISSQGDQEKKDAVAVRYRRYYPDDEGDLSHILDNTSESRKLSMLVHCIIRLREVYSIQPFTTPPQMDEHPMNLGNPQLRDAIQNKPMNVVKDIILANKSVDINTRSQSGDSALHRAAIEGDIDAIRIIINQGGNVNIRDRNGFQPVHQALSYHHYKAAMFLMDCGVDLMSYTSKRIQQFVTVRAIAKQYLRQTLKTPL